MKKEDAMDKLDRAEFAINDLNASAWNTALNPTRYGWVSSVFSIATIPVLSAASIGHLVTSAVVKQVDAGTFEKRTELPGGKPKAGPKQEP